MRGRLPYKVTCPDILLTLQTGKEGGTVPGKSRFACGACGATADIREAIAATGKNGPAGVYAVQGFCPECSTEGQAYNGRFFAPADRVEPVNAAFREWSARQDADLREFWPRSEVPFGFMTTMNNGGIQTHGYTHWWKMFNYRQLLTH